MSRTITFTLCVTLALTVATPTVTLHGGMAKGVIRYVDNTLRENCINGVYSIANRNCSGSDGNAYRTIEAAASGLGAGDLVNIRSSATIYTGTAAGSRISVSALGTGTSGNNLMIQKYPGDSATVYVRGIIDGPVTSKFITFKDFTINCGNFTPPVSEMGEGSGIVNVFGVRFENITVENCWRNAIQGVGNDEFINIIVRNNGFGLASGGFGVYTGTDSSGGMSYDGNLFDGGRYHNNKGYGIHCYSDCGNTIIRNLRVDHNGYNDLAATVSNNQNGIIMASKPGSRIYNVIADHNAGTGIWLAGSGTVGYNLTAYNNGASDIMVSSFPNIIVRNSIALNGIGDRDSLGYTGSNNITSGTASSYFVDAANGNFQLKPTSK